MQDLKGIRLSELPLGELVKVSDLLYFDGPLLSHFQSLDNDHYLFYWVDVDDQFNRWIIFRVSLEKIKRYLNRKDTLHTVLLTSIEEFVYKVDIDESLTYNNVDLIFIKDLPDNYLPEQDSFYNNTPQSEGADLSAYSKKYNSGILQAYFKDSEKVPYNEINLNLFGPAIFSLYEITEGLSKNYVSKRIKENSKDKSSKIKYEKEFLKSSTELNFFANIGGSFSALFKSASNSIPMPGMPSEEDSFIKYLMNFFTASEDIEKLSEYVKNLDNKIIPGYKFLLQTIVRNKLEFHLKWQNSITNVNAKQDLSFNKAVKIIDILEQLEYDDKIELKLTGRFVAAHTKTGSYEFEEIGGDNYSKGKMDEDRRLMSPLIKFNGTYNVVIERRETKQAGKKAPKIQDVLISFAETGNK